jgi:UDP-2-acetamido-2-deoxy-ribo-hexuluronate aminotransferase
MNPTEQAALRVLRSGRFVGGPEVEALETELASFVSPTPLQVVACASGTSALSLSLLALGLQAGDEVICPDFSFIATASPVALLGGVPVFADIELIGYALDPEAIEARITPRTKGIIAASLFGQCAQLEKISAVAKKHGLWLIEDAAQSFGARRGTWASCSCAHSDLAFTSFYPSKPLACCGDGGAIFTQNPEAANKLRMLRDHGASAKNHHIALGLNSRLDAIQAAILREKLKHYPAEIERRNTRAAEYAELCDQPARLVDGNTSIWSLYTIRTRDRAQIIPRLERLNIQYAVHYPLPLHKQPCFAGIPGIEKTVCPNAEQACAEVLSLYV